MARRSATAEGYLDSDIYLRDLSPVSSPKERCCEEASVEVEVEEVYVGREEDIKRDGAGFTRLCADARIVVEPDIQCKRSRIIITRLDNDDKEPILDVFMSHPVWVSRPGQVGMWLVLADARLGYLFVFDSDEAAIKFVADVNLILQQDRAIKKNLVREEQAVRNLFRRRAPDQTRRNSLTEMAERVMSYLQGRPISV